MLAQLILSLTLTTVGFTATDIGFGPSTFQWWLFVVGVCIAYICGKLDD